MRSLSRRHATGHVGTDGVGAHEFLNEHEKLKACEARRHLQAQCGRCEAQEAVRDLEDGACRQVPQGMRHKSTTPDAPGSGRQLHVDRKRRIRPKCLPPGEKGVAGAWRHADRRICAPVARPNLRKGAEPPQGLDRTGM